MGAEKRGTKSGGFFHLFDLNRKSRKKLFSNSPEGSKHEKKCDNSLPSMCLRLDDEDEVVGPSSVKESSDYSCASSVTDEGFSSRPPGVVARLMGLDSMPTSGASEPSSTPFFDSRFLREKHSHKRSPEFCITDQFNNISHRTESYSRKPMELRSQRMPSSPIERFQTETITPRSSRSLPLTHHKLLSPIKNPGFIFGKNAAHIMEAAAKILDPGLQPSLTSKVSSLGSCSIPLKVSESKQIMMATQSQRTARILESAGTPVHNLQGRSLNRCWNGPEDNSAYRRFSDFDNASVADAKSKGKSISLAIQAKVNIQRREGLSSFSTSTSAHKDNECEVNQSFRSQQNQQKKHKQQRKPATGNSSGVLKQNNQKQNCLSSRSKLSSKQSLTSQHGRKVISGSDATSMKNKIIKNPSGNSRAVNRKEGSETANPEVDELLSSDRDFPRKKRLIERGFVLEKDGQQKHVQPNIVIDEGSYSRWTEDSRSDGADVVSFTFTSPLIKPTSKMASSIINSIRYDTHNAKNGSDVKDRKAATHGLNVVTGDALSVLLEQKLRELASVAGKSNCTFVEADSSTASSPVMQGLSSNFDAGCTSTAESKRNLVHKPCRDNPAGAFHPGVPSTNGLVFGMSKLQRMEKEAECSTISDARKETDLHNLSPLSTLESSFSNGSFISTDSSSSSNGSQAKKFPEVEMELLDSASSPLTEISDASELTRSRKRANDDLDYVREVSSMWSPVLSETLDLLVFDKLESERTKDNKSRRKVVFDCVNECLDTKCSTYFRAGYGSWCKGMAVIGNKLAEDIYGEISGWKKNIGECTVDEAVDADMSSRCRGGWVDFEIEAFEFGREIGDEIVSSLVDDIIADYLISGH